MPHTCNTLQTKLNVWPHTLTLEAHSAVSSASSCLLVAFLWDINSATLARFTCTSAHEVLITRLYILQCENCRELKATCVQLFTMCACTCAGVFSSHL